MSSSSATIRVEKATSDLLIGPDWTLNMDICDSINTDHWQAKDVVKAVKKRLQHKNPTVQFLALTLLETMIKNCGDYVHFQVVEREILQEMVKIVKKKTDMQVRNKILVLLDSWQEAFGGPGGKYPQYYWAYNELRRSGVDFPQRSADSSLIFTPPVTHLTPVPRHPQVGYGMPNNSSTRLDEAMSSEMLKLSLADLDSIRSVMELLSDMLKAVDPNDREAIKDEIIMDLASQCRSNQRKLMQVLTSTGDEELLQQGLALNDSLQSLLAKHDAIASGSPLPAEPSETLPSSRTPIAPPPELALTVVDRLEDEEEEDDDFAQLARRNLKQKLASTQNTSSETGVHLSLGDSSDLTSATDASASMEASSSVASNALSLPDPPTPVKTATSEQAMIDLLSITLSTNPSPPHTPVATPSASNQNASPPPITPGGPGYPYGTQPYTANQGYASYNSYVAPWAQPQPPSPPQPQVPQFSSNYPPPPWGAPAASNPNPFMPTAYQFPASSSAHPPAAYVPMNASSRPLQQYSAAPAETRVNANQRQQGSSSAAAVGAKPYVPPYKLFDDLIELRNADGSLKTTSNALPRSSGTSSQSMIGGRK